MDPNHNPPDPDGLKDPVDNATQSVNVAQAEVQDPAVSNQNTSRFMPLQQNSPPRPAIPPHRLHPYVPRLPTAPIRRSSLVPPPPPPRHTSQTPGSLARSGSSQLPPLPLPRHRTFQTSGAISRARCSQLPPPPPPRHTSLTSGVMTRAVSSLLLPPPPPPPRHTSLTSGAMTHAASSLLLPPPPPPPRHTSLTSGAMAPAGRSQLRAQPPPPPPRRSSLTTGAGLLHSQMHSFAPPDPMHGPPLNSARSEDSSSDVNEPGTSTGTLKHPYAK